MLATTIPFWGAVVGIVAGVFAIGAGLAGFIAFFNANMGKTTLDLQKTTIDTLEQQNKNQQREIDGLKLANDALQKQVSAQQGQIDTLKQLASGKAAVEELGVVLDERHRQLMAAINGKIGGP